VKHTPPLLGIIALCPKWTLSYWEAPIGCPPGKPTTTPWVHPGSFKKRFRDGLTEWCPMGADPMWSIFLSWVICLVGMIWIDDHELCRNWIKITMSKWRWGVLQWGICIASIHHNLEVWFWHSIFWEEEWKWLFFLSVFWSS
jgi:hypothetical protein